MKNYPAKHEADEANAKKLLSYRGIYQVEI